MKQVAEIAVLLSLSLLVSLTIEAQCANAANACTPPVPHFVKFSGTVKNIAGTSPNGVVAIRFAIYGASTGGTPLWGEELDAQLDPQGHSYVMLGATGSEEIPMDLFTSGELRWLGVEVLPAERTAGYYCEYNIPYALQAANALTLCGLPVSALPKAATSSVVLNSLCSETGSAAQISRQNGLVKVGGSPSEQRYHRT
jgi:hypothetical protein